jgi:hypothetical protein
MGAGLTKKQIYNRIYDSLQNSKWKIIKAGGIAEYRERALRGIYKNQPFKISFDIYHASNGEVAGIRRFYPKEADKKQGMISNFKKAMWR